MSRKHIVLLAIVGILLLALSIFGCQGYKAPTYKSPADSDDEGIDEIEIDVSDLGDEEDDDFWADEEETLDDEEELLEDEEETLEDEEEIESYMPAEDDEEEDDTAAYTPVKTTTSDTTTTSSDDEADSDFKKSPYRPVVEDDLPTLTVTEGEMVKLSVKATDADGDPLTYEFTAPLNSEGKWQTRTGDSGVYYPTVTVSDGKTEVTKELKIVVEPLNNKPVLQFIPNVEVEEGQTVVLKPRATDADGDKLQYSYSGWMSESTKTTTYKDAGVHKVTVSVTDGISTVSQDVTVTVKDVNRAPEVEIEF